jgi:hypothetical protein
MRLCHYQRVFPHAHASLCELLNLSSVVMQYVTQYLNIQTVNTVNPIFVQDANVAKAIGYFVEAIAPILVDNLQFARTVKRPMKETSKAYAVVYDSILEKLGYILRSFEALFDVLEIDINTS